MPTPVDQGGPTESWGQQKKLGTESTAETSATSPAADSTAEPAEPMASPALTVSAASASAPAPATGVAPIPDRLRDLIALHSRRDSPVLTELHTLAQRLHESQAWTNQVGLAPAAVQRTAAEIIAHASESLRAQATQTRDGVRALLALEG